SSRFSVVRDSLKAELQRIPKNSSSTVANAPYSGQSKSLASHLYHACRGRVSQSMVEDKLGAVEQRPEDVGQGAPAVAGGCGALNIGAHANRLFLTRQPAKRRQIQRLDALGGRPVREFRGRRERHAPLDARGIGDELAVHESQGLQDRGL